MSRKLFLTAFSRETECVLKANPNFEVVQVGQGRENVHSFFKENSKSKKIDFTNYDDFFLVGFCGALSEKHKVGDLAIPNIVLIDDGELRLSKGKDETIFTSDKIIGKAKDRQLLHQKTKAEFVDMESYYVVSHLRECKVVKAVMDDFSFDLPDTVKEIKSNSNLIKKINTNIDIASLKLSEFLKTL